MQTPLKTPLTPSILKFFINSGYEYCLCRYSYTGKAVSAILLTPLKERPGLKKIQHYDFLFAIREEPLEMVRSADGPPVMIELEADSLVGFVSYVLNTRPKK